MPDIRSEWVVAPDAGRPEGRSCLHLAEVAEVAEVAERAGTATAETLRTGGIPDSGCAQCRAVGQRWVHLRFCLSCGHVGCCDSSRGQHAWVHAETTGHPLASSAEDGEDWAWCYVDELFLVPVRRSDGGRPPR